MEYIGGGSTSSDVLTLGKNDSSVSQTSPNINVTNTAINFGSSGTFNFYDGTITSTNIALTLNVDNLPSSYSIVYSNSNKTATLEEEEIPEFYVDTYEYMKELIDTYDKVKLIVDNEINFAFGGEYHTLYIPEGKTVDIELYYDIHNRASGDYYGNLQDYIIENHGSLMITGEGKYIWQCSDGCGTAIINYGELIIGVDVNISGDVDDVEGGTTTWL